jgi:hypothetical protein
LAFFCHQPETVEELRSLCTVEFCSDLGVSNLNLEGDSLNVVIAIKGRGSPRGRYGQVVEDIQQVLKGFRRCVIGHVKRGANSCAYRLAKIVAKEIYDKIWMEETPNFIFDIVSLELSALFI